MSIFIHDLTRWLVLHWQLKLVETLVIVLTLISMADKLTEIFILLSGTYTIFLSYPQRWRMQVTDACNISELEIYVWVDISISWGPSCQHFDMIESLNFLFCLTLLVLVWPAREKKSVNIMEILKSSVNEKLFYSSNFIGMPNLLSSFEFLCIYALQI